MTERLTSLSHGAGCACKMPLKQLTELMGTLIPSADPRLLVGPDLGDDAAVWHDGVGDAVVATTDFFTPIVDDPRDWGRIAAANAASDVYAMGGQPLFALNVVGWPKDRDLSELQATMAGAREIAATGGWLVVGGHTIDAREPFFGQAVIGRVPPHRITSNAGALPGDALVLTKAIGTGIVMTAAKRQDPSAVRPHGSLAEAYAAAVDSMTQLNADASRALVDADAHAVTDVTGFGLLGHLQRMTVASGVHAEIDPDAVPLLPSVAELQAAGFVPGGTLANLDFLRPHLRAVPDDATLTRLADAQTSGGLLAALDRDAAEDVARSLRDQGHRASVIGTIGTGEPGTVSFA